MIDLHIHSNFSPDSKTPLKDIVEATKGYDVVAITDHYEFDSDFKIENIDNYVKTISEINKNSRQKILVGIEIGMIPGRVPDINFSLFDYVIGSVHSVKEIKDVKDSDPTFIIDEYIETTYECVLKNDYFNSLGHLDYILRYTKIDSLKDYKSDLFDILKLLVKKDKLLEVNTSAFYHNLNRPHPEWWVIEKFFDIGGKITIGSDSHKIDKIGYKISQTLEKLKIIGFREIYYFEKGLSKCITL